jgi:anti-sigma regulatory factor (Ser/Thr protein kinase)
MGLQRLGKAWFWRRNRVSQTKQKPMLPSPPQVEAPVVDIAPDDPMVTLQRTGEQGISTIITATPSENSAANDPWHLLAELSIPSAPGNERLAIEQVADVVKELDLPARRLERLKTAVAETVMNAMEYGNKYQPDMPVCIRVLTSETDLAVRIEDQGGNMAIPDPVIPDIEAKLAELQSPRGWGLFLIKNLVDDMSITSDGMHHTVELIMHLEGR